MLSRLLDIARSAGDAILEVYAHADLEVQTKPDQSPVTRADLLAHELICNALNRHWPTLPVLSEESSAEVHAQRHHWQRYWLVDPLDGTKEFIHRNGDFTVNIALIDQGQPVLGVVHIPVSDISYTGEINLQSVSNTCQTAADSAYKYQAGRRSRIHTRPFDPARGLDLQLSRSHPDPRLPDYLQRLQQQANVRCHSRGSSLKVCLVAEGAADLHLRLGPTSEWDTGASQAVLVAAGGALLDFQGKPLAYNQRPQLLNPDFIACGDPQQPWLDWLGQ